MRSLTFDRFQISLESHVHDFYLLHADDDKSQRNRKRTDILLLDFRIFKRNKRGESAKCV